MASQIAMTQPHLDIESLSFAYPDGQLALDRVSFHVSPGEKVALVGPNGAGKSTLLHHLNGLLRAKSGHIRIDGLPLTPQNLGQIRAWVGLVFQNPDDQLFSLRVEQDVGFGPRYLGLPEREIECRVQNALAAVGMSAYADRLSMHLSVGEKKRIAIATVLSMTPKILALDEPSAGLDPRARRNLIDLLRGFEQTMLISTHDMRLARDLCSQAIVLDGGRLIAHGTATEILMNRALMEGHGLEVP